MQHSRVPIPRDFRLWQKHSWRGFRHRWYLVFFGCFHRSHKHRKLRVDLGSWVRCNVGRRFGRDPVVACSYSVSREHERGGFRYLSLITNTSATIEVTGVSTILTAAPVSELQAYTGYFRFNDGLLNRI